jgi:hypothetical protein
MHKNELVLTNFLIRTEKEYLSTYQKTDRSDLALSIIRLVKPIFYFLDVVFIIPLHHFFRQIEKICVRTEDYLDDLDRSIEERGDAMDRFFDNLGDMVDSVCHPNRLLPALTVIATVSLVALAILTDETSFYYESQSYIF